MILENFENRQPSLWDWAERGGFAFTSTYAETYLQNRYNVPAHRARLLAELSGMGGAI